jgi:anti-sigma regulatory factor (Ser/Thr protein kinase)
MLQLDRALIPSPSAAGDARALLSTWLCGILDSAVEATAQVVGTASLVVSELVTNAVQAGATDIQLWLHVEPDHPGTLHIDVEDDAAGEPVKQALDPARLTGRGLLLIDAISDRWGVAPARTSGKSVWAALSIPAANGV